MSFSSDVISKIEYVCAAAYSNKKRVHAKHEPLLLFTYGRVKTATIYR